VGQYSIGANTYIQSPEHDREFLANWGRRIGRPIVHDVTEGAPLPNSFKPIKAIKYRHRVTEESISSDRQ